MRAVRQGLKMEVEANSESTPRKPGPVLSPRKWAAPAWLLGWGRPRGFRGKLTQGKPQLRKRRDSVSLVWNKLFGGRHWSGSVWYSRRNRQSGRGDSGESAVEPAHSQGAGPLLQRSSASPSRRDQGPPPRVCCPELKCF